MHVIGPQIGANHILVRNDVPRGTFGNHLSVIENYDVTRDGHDCAHHVLNDDDGQSRFESFPTSATA